MKIVRKYGFKVVLCEELCEEGEGKGALGLRSLKTFGLDLRNGLPLCHGLLIVSLVRDCATCKQIALEKAYVVSLHVCYANKNPKEFKCGACIHVKHLSKLNQPCKHS